MKVTLWKVMEYVSQLDPVLLDVCATEKDADHVAKVFNSVESTLRGVAIVEPLELTVAEET